MAIDSQTKRRTLFGLGRPAAVVLQRPNGAVEVADRATCAFLALPYQASLAWGLELELDGPGNGWTDVTAHVSHEVGVTCSYGIDGAEPVDCVAGPGSLRFALNAPEDQAIDYYSPYSANRRAGFDFNIGVRFWLYQGTERSYKHVGRLADIQPTPGRPANRDVHCQSFDWLDDAMRTEVPDLPAQSGETADSLIATILDALTTQPTARDIEAGVATFGYALDGGTGQRQKVREELIKIAASERGYVTIRGDDATGGVFDFRARGSRTLTAATEYHFEDSALSRAGLVTVGSRDDVFRTVQVIVHPTSLDAGDTTVLFALAAGAEVLVQPGQTVDTIFGPYRNPDTNEACGGVDMQAPVATTDYTANSAANGSGSDLTADITVTANYTGQGVRYELENTGATAAYITKLQARGRGVYRTDVLIERSVAGSYGDRTLTIDMPYESSLNTATNIATYLATVLALPAARVRAIKFCASVDDELMAQAITREPNDRIAISEPVLGLVEALFTINRVTLTIERGNVLHCDWGLVPWGLDAWFAPVDFEATGGTITEAGGFRIHTFTGDGTFEIVAGDPTSVEYLIVGGGGGGGAPDSTAAGGGAGGRVRTGTVSLGVGTYPVVVGDGGAGGLTGDGSDGEASSFAGVTAEGGSGGGAGNNDGRDGTLGGGAGSGGNNGDGTLYDGGDYGANGGGGGAGAGGRGGNSPGFGRGGAGGPAVSSAISGASVGYGGGGGGGGSDTGGTAGAGGGDGRSGTGGGHDAVANRGGGGGGARFSGTGGDGSAGIVIIRYPTGA